MKLFQWSPDGGKFSGVNGFFLIECKSLFSIAILKFNKGSREAYHSHAFNAITIWLKGRVLEHHLKGYTKYYHQGQIKYTSREIFHKIEALEVTWALTFRGPWKNYWQENYKNQTVTLTHGRKHV